MHTADLLTDGDEGDTHGARPLTLMVPFEDEGATESTRKAYATAVRLEPGDLRLGEVVTGRNHHDGANQPTAAGQPQFTAADRNDSPSALQTTLQRFVLDGGRCEDRTLEGFGSRKVTGPQLDGLREGVRLCLCDRCSGASGTGQRDRHDASSEREQDERYSGDPSHGTHHPMRS